MVKRDTSKAQRAIDRIRRGPVVCEECGTLVATQVVEGRVLTVMHTDPGAATCGPDEVRGANGPLTRT